MKYPNVKIKNGNTGEVIEIDMAKVCSLSGQIDDKSRTRAYGTFHKKGIYLNSEYDWVIVKDEYKELVLLKLIK